MTHLLGKKRKFSGEWFTAQAARKNKTAANTYAENKRKQGFKARIVPAKEPGKGKEYYIFTRKGRKVKYNRCKTKKKTKKRTKK